MPELQTQKNRDSVVQDFARMFFSRYTMTHHDNHTNTSLRAWLPTLLQIPNEWLVLVQQRVDPFNMKAMMHQIG